MSAEASVVSGIAGRYATALFELARDNGVLDQVASDASDLGNMIEESDDLGRLLRSPVIAAEDQGKGIAAVLEKAAQLLLAAKETEDDEAFYMALNYNQRIWTVIQTYMIEENPLPEQIKSNLINDIHETSTSNFLSVNDFSDVLA